MNMGGGIFRAFLQVLARAVTGFNAHDGEVQAGYIAYALMLAIFPFLIFAVSLTGWMIGEARSAEAIQVLFDFAPDYLAVVLEPELARVLGQSHGLFTLFIVLAVWAAMRAVEAVNKSFDGIYGARAGAIWLVRKGKALVVVFGAAIVAVVLGLSILLAPVLITLLENYTTVELPKNLLILRYGVGFSALYAFLWVMHWFLPNSHARGFSIWPGALLSTLLWVGMATGMSFYLAYAGNYSVTYGALSGIVITLLFLYFSGAIIIFGAEFNAALRSFRERIE